jgi:hypothetical protein
VIVLAVRGAVLAVNPGSSLVVGSRASSAFEALVLMVADGAGAVAVSAAVEPQPARARQIALAGIAVLRGPISTLSCFSVPQEVSASPP